MYNVYIHVHVHCMYMYDFTLECEDRVFVQVMYCVTFPHLPTTPPPPPVCVYVCMCAGVESYSVFPQSCVPFSVVQFLIAFLDGALLYMVHYSSEVKGQQVYIHTCLYVHV